jgi:uncharacterized protein (DUF1684 family)
MRFYVFSILTFVIAGCGQSSAPVSNDTACLSNLVEHRSSIDARFANDEYPLSEAQKASFHGLNYFPPNTDYCFPARFETAAARETFDMPTYNEKSIPFRQYGTLEFQFDGVAYTLTAFQRMDLPEEERQWVLVPFKDTTNGHETYGGGRYLEIKLPINVQTEIDFNRAANPWCAYDARYTCPIPPVENWLSFSIEAGEKTFAAHDADLSGHEAVQE